MKFFIDSADIGEIREALSMGICDGVTTNPSLVAKTGKTFAKVIDEIVHTVPGPVSLEVTALTRDEMLVQGEELASFGKNVVIKLPLTRAGLQACKVLSDKKIATNVTLCFSASQALLAAKAGASYISPFVGRLDDISADGMALVDDIVTIYDNYDFRTEVLVASIRHPEHVVDAARMGAHVATVPLKVLAQMFHHPLTDSGIERFMADWEKVPAS